jgi:hypothetical protein
VVLESEDLRPHNDISKSVSDTKNGHSSGRRMAMVEWRIRGNQEDELDWLKDALRQYARERLERHDSEETYPKCRPRKRKYSA